MDRKGLLSLDGRVAFVSGAGQGVGRAAALRFAEHGCATVIVNDFFGDRAEAVCADVEALGARAIPAVFDVTDYEAAREAVTAAARQAGGLDIVVNNAGNAGPTADMTRVPFFIETGPEEWESWLGPNLYGVLHVCRAALPIMVEQGRGGSVINVISDAGRVGEPRLAVYSGAKAGAAAFSRALAKEVGRNNIRVNAVSLSGIKTPGIAHLLSDPEIVKRIEKQYPLGRMGQPEEPANMILFLASDASVWITAQTYPVNGGYAISQ